MANTPLQMLLEQADAAVARGAHDVALKVVLDILHQVASGTLTVTDTDLTDDVNYFEDKSAADAAAGDTAGAAKAADQANLLKSAETLVAEAEGKTKARRPRQK